MKHEKVVVMTIAELSTAWRRCPPTRQQEPAQKLQERTNWLPFVRRTPAAAGSTGRPAQRTLARDFLSRGREKPDRRGPEQPWMYWVKRGWRPRREGGRGRGGKGPEGPDS